VRWRDRSIQGELEWIGRKIREALEVKEKDLIGEVKEKKG